MNKKDFDNLFAITNGGLDKIKQRASDDWCSLQFDYQVALDAACKDGYITQNQYNKWVIPWKQRRR